jgi:hypothetical protein
LNYAPPNPSPNPHAARSDCTWHLHHLATKPEGEDETAVEVGATVSIDAGVAVADAVGSAAGVACVSERGVGVANGNSVCVALGVAETVGILVRVGINGSGVSEDVTTDMSLVAKCGEPDSTECNDGAPIIINAMPAAINKAAASRSI